MSLITVIKNFFSMENTDAQEEKKFEFYVNLPAEERFTLSDEDVLEAVEIRALKKTEPYPEEAEGFFYPSSLSSASISGNGCRLRRNTPVICAIATP